MSVAHNILGNTGESVSRLGFGCMRLPLRGDGRVDRETTEKMFALALDNGVNYFDTAYNYLNMESEVVVGEILGRYERSRYYVTTKLPLIMLRSYAECKEVFATQKERLKCGIDHYLLHGVNARLWENVKKWGLIDFMQELKAGGEIGSFGFSFHDSYECFDEVIHAAPWDLCQIQYNYMDENTQAGTRGYELCRELGIPMVVMEPVRGGALARLSEDLEETLRALHPDWSTASWALRWVAAHENVKVTLSGMSTLQQVEDNIRTFSDLRPLTEEENAAIAHAVEVMTHRLANGCTGCRYCMPCPNGVKIPEVFSAWNRYTQFRNYGVVSSLWERRLKMEDKPASCVGCGACEEKCPQHLPIREDLLRASADLDDPVWK